MNKTMKGTAISLTTNIDQLAVYSMWIKMLVIGTLFACLSGRVRSRIVWKIVDDIEIIQNNMYCAMKSKSSPLLLYFMMLNSLIFLPVLLAVKMSIASAKISLPGSLGLCHLKSTQSSSNDTTLIEVTQPTVYFDLWTDWFFSCKLFHGTRAINPSPISSKLLATPMSICLTNLVS